MVCELDGPIPILKISKTLKLMGNPENSAGNDHTPRGAAVLAGAQPVSLKPSGVRIQGRIYRQTSGIMGSVR
jgi:hypothetical protein